MKNTECCADGPCDSGLRNQYFEGKRLTADSFRVEQNYLLERRRLLNRTIHGWGVVYGYAMKPARADNCRTEDESARSRSGRAWRSMNAAASCCSPKRSR
jgi:hypothetical protein